MKKRKLIIAAAGFATMIGMESSTSVAFADQSYILCRAAKSEAEKYAMTKTVRQTIRYIDKDTGKQMDKYTKDNVQVITFHRKELWDRKTKKPTGVYTNWDGPKTTKAVRSYEYPGYTASEKVVPKQVYKATDHDRVITVFYTKNPVRKSTQRKAVTRTIKIYRPKKGLKKVIQKVYIKRTVETDLKTPHEKTYGMWSNAYWNAYKVPQYKGYKASKKIVKKQNVVKTIKNKTGIIRKIDNKIVKITYKKIK